MAVEGQVGPHTDEVFSAAPVRADRPAPAAYVVAVIDDQPITRSGMERLVAEQPRFTVAASVASADQLDTAGEAGGYDVAILALPPRARGSGGTFPSGRERRTWLTALTAAWWTSGLRADIA